MVALSMRCQSSARRSRGRSLVRAPKFWLPLRARRPTTVSNRSWVHFARATRSVVDLLSPAAVQVHPSYLELEDECVRTLALVSYPRYVHPGWLRPIQELDEPVVLSQHLYPLESKAVIGSPTRTPVQLQTSRF